MRFRKRVSLIPGLRLNLSKSGVSLSAGPRGASLTLGKRGIYRNIGLTGTGLYDRTRLGGTSKATSIHPRGLTRREIALDSLEHIAATKPQLNIPLAGGDVELLASDGQPLSVEFQAVAWKHLGDMLRTQVEEACTRTREVIDKLTQLHADTPPPLPPIAYREIPFTKASPVEPVMEEYDWLWRLFPMHRRAVDDRNHDVMSQHEEEIRDWNADRINHDVQQREVKALFNARDSASPEGIERFLVWRFSEIDWPKQTDVELSVSPDGKQLALDVDLPEIEDLPCGTPEPISRGRRIKWKPLSDTAKRRMYASHIRNACSTYCITPHSLAVHL